MNTILIFLSISFNLNEGMELLHKALASYDSVRTISVEVYIRESSSFDTTVEASRLHLYFKKPDKVRYDFIEPDTAMIIADGERIWLYRPGDTVAFYQPAPRDKNYEKTPLSSLHLIDSLLEIGFRVSDSGYSRDSTVRIVLVPDSFAGIDMKVEIEINRKDTTVKSILIAGPDFSNKTEYFDYIRAGDGIKLPTRTLVTKTLGKDWLTDEMEFRRLKVNVEIPDSVFQFIPPPGVHLRPLPFMRK